MSFTFSHLHMPSRIFSLYLPLSLFSLILLVITKFSIPSPRITWHMNRHCLCFILLIIFCMCWLYIILDHLSYVLRMIHVTFFLETTSRWQRFFFLIVYLSSMLHIVWFFFFFLILILVLSRILLCLGHNTQLDFHKIPLQCSPQILGVKIILKKIITPIRLGETKITKYLRSWR
jgi:hypothetical protein